MPIIVKKDGRTIRKGKDYTTFRLNLWLKQEGRCAVCGQNASITADWQSDYSFHVHHKNGRGLGGGKRDDTTESCIGLCGRCHRLEHNQ